MIASVETVRIGTEEKKPIKNYSLWLGPGTLVFAGHPDDIDPVSSGIIPGDTEVLVRTIYGWPRKKAGYVPVCVIKTSLLATDDNHIVEYYRGEHVLSVGGFTVGQDSMLWVGASSFNKRRKGNEVKEGTTAFQARLAI